MNVKASMMVSMLVAALSGSALAAEDWQQQRAEVAAQLAAEPTYRLQQQVRTRSRSQAHEQAAEVQQRRERQQNRWQQQQQGRERLWLSAGNTPQRSTLSSRGPR